MIDGPTTRVGIKHYITREDKTSQSTARDDKTTQAIVGPIAYKSKVAGAFHGVPLSERKGPIDNRP